MKQGLSIIIINYYSEKYIIPLVKDIISSIAIEGHEVIIISNSPSNFPWTKEYLKINNILIIESTSNYGFGISMNTGISYSKYTDICMLNPDIKINNNTLNELYVYLQTLNEEIGAISCIIKNSDGSRQTTFFMDKGLSIGTFTFTYFKKIFPTKISNYLFSNSSSAIDKLNFSAPFEVGGFYCPMVMMKKNTFFEIGSFDPDFFMYGEDIDFFRTRFPKKYKCMVYPHVELIHFSGKTDKYGLMPHQAQVSYLLYLRKVGTSYLFIYIFMLSIRYSLLLVYSFFNKKRYRKEALGFFKSLTYLLKIFKYRKGYATLPNSLKIDEIPD